MAFRQRLLQPCQALRRANARLMRGLLMLDWVVKLVMNVIMFALTGREGVGRKIGSNFKTRVAPIPLRAEPNQKPGDLRVHYT
jgi:hypothetical protein